MCRFKGPDDSDFERVVAAFNRLASFDTQSKLHPDYWATLSQVEVFYVNNYLGTCKFPDSCIYAGS